MTEIAGLKLIVPSSVAGSGVSLSGAKVTFTAATSVSVNGCFSSTYDNYLIVIRNVGTADTGIRYRMRLSGTDASGTDYAMQFLTASSTTVSGSRTTSQAQGFVAETSNGNYNGHHAYFYGPALAQPTALRSVSVVGLSGATIGDRAGTHSLSTAYDGFTLSVSSGNITGALTIYGLSQ